MNPSAANKNHRIGGVLQFLRICLTGYGVLAFAPHPATSALVLIASFFHPVVGAMGLVGNVISNLTARWFGAEETAWRAGIFGVSGILVGLGIGMHAVPNARMAAFFVIGAALSGIISVLLATLFAKNDMPTLSAPFMIIIWPLLLTIGVAKSGTDLFVTLELLSIFDKWLFNALPLGMFQFVKAFGNILFQENLISGVFVLAALAMYSRLSLIYGIWGSLLGVLTYYFLHGSLDGFHGLNYVLTALAFGGFFVIANINGWLLASLAVIMAGIIDYAALQVLGNIKSTTGETLPTLVFAFNAVTLAILYPLKLLYLNQKKPRLIPVPLSVIKSPEANLRWAKRWLKRRDTQKTSLTFPILGKWTILQGNDGEWTHKRTFRYAWDFVVKDKSGRQYHGLGLEVTDFYAFGLPVLAPAAGMVYAVENTVDDNPPRTAVTERNWGNYVIIDHGAGEYSEISHFKQGSVVVYPGQKVSRGQLLGHCGNSGRSPVPHIHFQLQKTPKIGSETIPAKFSEGVVNGAIVINHVPEKNDEVAPVEIEPEVEWTLLGKETELWIYECRMGMVKCRDKLFFGTDIWGAPAILGKNHFLWYLIDRPGFIEIIPDYKTFPSLLSPSGWMRAVGESLLLPKKLKRNLSWNGGKVVAADGDRWTVETGGRSVVIDAKSEKILEIESTGKTEYRLELIESKG